MPGSTPGNLFFYLKRITAELVIGKIPMNCRIGEWYQG